MSGREDQITGKAKELQGKLTGDAEKESEGQVQNAVGKLEKRAETAVDRAKGAAKAAAAKRPRRCFSACTLDTRLLVRAQ